VLVKTALKALFFTYLISFDGEATCVLGQASLGCCKVTKVHLLLRLESVFLSSSSLFSLN